MTLRFPSWLRRAKPFPASSSPAWPHAQPDAGPVEYAFTSGGRPYFRFTAEDALPKTRFHAAQDYQLELSFRTSREYLADLYDSVLSACNQGRMAEIAVVVTEAKRRLDWITDVGLLFKLATCYYFTADEDPHHYDRTRAGQHVAHWQAHEKDLPAFFLKTRLASLLPSADFVASNIQTYTSATAKIEAAHLRSFLLLASSGPDAPARIQNISSRAATLSSWADSLDSVSSAGAAG